MNALACLTGVGVFVDVTVEGRGSIVSSQIVKGVIPVTGSMTNISTIKSIAPDFEKNH